MFRSFLILFAPPPLQQSLGAIISGLLDEPASIQETVKSPTNDDDDDDDDEKD